jgi:hypothetical protein
MAMKPVTGKLRKGGGKGASGDALVGNVTQSTIDSIKKMGMTEALKLAGKNNKTSGGMAREFQEGVRRMYGADRLAAAKTKYGKPAAAKPSTASRPPVAKPKASTASRPPVAAKATTKPAAAMAAKKSGTTDPLAKFVFGIGKALKGGDRMTAAQVAAENKRRIAASKNK